MWACTSSVRGPAQRSDRNATDLQAIAAFYRWNRQQHHLSKVDKRNREKVKNVELPGKHVIMTSRQPESRPKYKSPVFQTTPQNHPTN